MAPLPAGADGAVLLVEDDPAARRAIEIVLGQALGLRVRAVAGGRDAILEMARAAPRLLLLDLGLQDTDGFAVLRWLAGRGMPVPVVAMTEAAPAAVSNARALGCRACLSKPVGIAELVAAVRRELAAAVRASASSPAA